MLSVGDQHAQVWDVIRQALPGVYVGRAIPASYPDRMVIVNRDASLTIDPRHQSARFRVRVLAKRYQDADRDTDAIRRALEGITAHDWIVSARRDLGPMDVDDPSGLVCIYQAFAVAWRTN